MAAAWTCRGCIGIFPTAIHSSFNHAAVLCPVGAWVQEGDTIQSSNSFISRDHSLHHGVSVFVWVSGQGSLAASRRRQDISCEPLTPPPCFLSHHFLSLFGVVVCGVAPTHREKASSIYLPYLYTILNVSIQ